MKTTYGQIHDVEVKEDGSIFVKIIADGQLIGTNVPERIKQTGIEQSPSVDKTELRFKLIKVNEDSESSVKASEGYSSLIGDKNTRITSTARYGNFIVGPTTFTSHPEQIRIGGVYRLNGLMTSTMPSTIITPIPTLVFDFPLEDFIKHISTLVNEYEDFLKDIL